jgi:hypothetical protein
VFAVPRVVFHRWRRIDEHLWGVTRERPIAVRKVAGRKRFFRRALGYPIVSAVTTVYSRNGVPSADVMLRIDRRCVSVTDSCH